MENKNNKKVVVIGAGPCGLAAAYQAQRAGYQVTLLEKSDIPGGKGGSRKVKNFVVDFGPHAYHAMTNEITDFMKKHSNGELMDVQIKQRLYITDKPMNYPMNIKEALTKFSFGLNVRILFDFFMAKLRSLFIKPPKNSFKQFGEANFGKTLYDLCFGRYSERVWRRSTDDLSVEYAKRKLPNTSLWEFVLELLTKHQRKNKKSYLHVRRYMYHKNGIGNIYKSIADGIISRGGTIVYNCVIENIDLSDDHKATSVNIESPEQTKIECDYLISTIPIDDLVAYTNSRITDFDHMQEKLPFKHGIVVNTVVNRRQFSDAHWIYLVNDRFYFTRLSEQKNFSKLCAPDDKTLLMLEKILSPGDEEWGWNASRWKEKALQDLEFFGITENEIADVFITKIEKAYPLYLVGYEQAKEKVLGDFGKFKNIVTTGRYGLFMDINMHDAMVLGVEGFKYLIDDKLEEFYRDHEVICSRKRNQEHQ